MKVLFLESDGASEYNCSYWRCVVPHKALLRAGHQSLLMRIEEWFARTPRSMQATEEADLVVLQRNAFAPEAHTNLVEWRARGKPVVVDLDDAYKYMTAETGSPSYDFWHAGMLDQGEGQPKIKYHPILPHTLLEYGVKLASGISSPSALICEDWKDYNRTYLFPNYIDTGLYHRYQAYREPGRVYIGWGGSMTHMVSFERSGLPQALAHLVQAHPNITLVVVGDPRTERFFGDIPKRNRAFVGWVPQPLFPSRLSLIDIGLVPLYGEYDRRRSWIKAMEFTVMGTPWIGTDAEPTRGIETGRRVQNTTEAWYEALTYYYDNLPALKAAAEANATTARGRFGVDENIGSLVSLFEKMIKEGKT